MMPMNSSALSAAPTVSIFTVCRDSAATIGRTLDSVAAQTYPHIEYIVVDGGSTDGTLDMVRSCPAVTRWVSEPDGGIANAFNKGLAMTSGAWIGIINADDWYEPDAVERVIRAADDADLIHGVVRYWAGDKPREEYHPCQERLPMEMTINHPSVFVRRSVYAVEGGFDSAYRFAMDYELLLRLYRRGYRFKALSGHAVANMRYGGASDRFWVNAYWESFRAKCAHGLPLAASFRYFLWQVTRGSVRRCCEALGLEKPARWVRGRFSPMRKV